MPYPIACRGGKIALPSGMLPFSDDFNRADGSVGNGWNSGGFFSLLSGKLLNTPTYGATRLTNGGFEGTYVSGVAPGWGALGGSSTCEEELVIVHGGSKAQRVNSISNYRIEQNSPTPTYTRGMWYVAQAYVYTVAQSLYMNILVYDGTSSVVGKGIGSTAGAWTELLFIGRTMGTGGGGYWRINSNTNPGIFIADDAGMFPIDTTKLFLTQDFGQNNVDISIKMSMPQYTGYRQPAGIVACLNSESSPNSYLHAYVIDTSIRLDKMVSGTISNLFDVANTYSENAVLRLVKNGTQVSVYYNGTQKGTTQTVSDGAIVNNTIHGLFATHPSTKLDDFSIAVAS